MYNPNIKDFPIIPNLLTFVAGPTIAASGTAVTISSNLVVNGGITVVAGPVKFGTIGSITLNYNGVSGSILQLDSTATNTDFLITSNTSGHTDSDGFLTRLTSGNNVQFRMQDNGGFSWNSGIGGNTLIATLLNDGSLGLGGYSPVQQLQIDGGAAGGVGIKLTNNGSGHTLTDGFSLDMDSSQEVHFRIYEGSGNRGYYWHTNNGTDQIMRLAGSGSLQIGDSGGPLLSQSGTKLVVSNDLQIGASPISLQANGGNLLNVNGGFTINNGTVSLTDIGSSLLVSGGASLGGNLVFTTDALRNIGNVSSGRPQNIYLTNTANALAFISTNTGAPATVGPFRMGNNEHLNWRNFGNSANLGLHLDTSNTFQLDSNLTISSSSTTGTFLSLLNSDTGGRAFELRSTGSGNSPEGAGSFILTDVNAGQARRITINSAGNIKLDAGSQNVEFTGSNVIVNGGIPLIFAGTNQPYLQKATSGAFRILVVNELQFENNSDGPIISRVSANTLNVATQLQINGGAVLSTATSAGGGNGLASSGGANGLFFPNNAGSAALDGSVGGRALGIRGSDNNVRRMILTSFGPTFGEVIMSGNVPATGNSSGAGWTSTNPTAGNWIITFTAGIFQAGPTPRVVVTANGVVSNYYVANWGEDGVNTVHIRSAVAPANTAFTFFAMGNRDD